MKKFTLFFLFLCVLVLGGWFFWQIQLSAIDTTNTTKQEFVVAQGTATHAVADNLQSQGLIRNALAFLLYMKLSGMDGKIQKGTFTLSQNMSCQQIAQQLTHGIQDVWITVIPGKRADEIADLLQNKLPSYQPSWRAQLEAREGYLFPDTYQFSHDATIEQIISIMTSNFDQKYQQALTHNTTHLTQQQAVILASIVQREAPSGIDMRKVASVLENRLNLGMALQVDATVQYALGYQPQEQTWWKKNLTATDLQIVSPYNTYTNPGLPPTPISNPDLEALEAVLNPADTNYLYYISDNKGVMHYAATLEEHNANIRTYGL